MIRRRNFNIYRPGNGCVTDFLRICLVLAVALASALQGGCEAAEPWQLWYQYVTKYVDDQGRVIDKQGNDRTTSEGQAYAMFFALVAGDRTRFDKLLEWSRLNLAAGDLARRLPAWSWGKTPDGQWRVLDENSASDADLWMSYVLLEAGRLWKEPGYESLGRQMAVRIAQQDVVFLPGFGLALLPGPTGFHPDANSWIVNPSYTPLPVLARLAEAMPDGPWRELVNQQPKILRACSSGGYAMDWVRYRSIPDRGLNDWMPVALPAQNTGQRGLSGGRPSGSDLAGQQAGDRMNQPDGAGSYDAIRVYLWAGMTNPATPQARNSLGAIPAMAEYLKVQPEPPAKVDAKGQVMDPKGPVGFSAAVVPYLPALGLKKKAEGQLKLVAAARNPSTGLYGRDQAYYDQNLVLFALGWSEGRFRFDRAGKLQVEWK